MHDYLYGRAFREREVCDEYMHEAMLDLREEGWKVDVTPSARIAVGDARSV